MARAEQPLSQPVSSGPATVGTAKAGARKSEKSDSELSLRANEGLRIDHPRKRQIIHAFRAVLIKEGYAAVSMRRVADECGMKLGNLQYYYPTRDELLDAFIRHWIELEQAGRALLLSEADASIEGILNWIDGAMAHFTQRNFENAIATAELFALAQHCDRTRAYLDRWYEEELAFYAMMIRAAVPGCDRRGSERKASALMALLEGLVMQFALRTPLARDQLTVARRTLRDGTSAILEATPDSNSLAFSSST
jgi:AcrR family transcriptional regulator